METVGVLTFFSFLIQAASWVNSTIAADTPIPRIALPEDIEITEISLIDGGSRSKRAIVHGCPTSCSQCSFFGTDLSIQNCSSDLKDDLPDFLKLHPNVTTLSIIDTKLSEVPCEVFALSQLTRLILRKNRIQTMPWDCLRTLPLLQEIDLYRNNISILHNGSFYDFPSLKRLYIDYNELSTIEPDVFLQSDRLPRLMEISLTNNKLATLDSWPVSLIMNRKFPGLHITFADNHISRFTNFAGISPSCDHFKLSFISLINNRISHLMDIFTGWNLDTSSLEHLHRCIDLMLIAFDENPLVCDCVDYEVYRYTRDLRLFNFISLSCAKPDRLRDRLSRTVPLDQFQCELKDICPQGCSCINVPYYRNVSIRCDNYKGMTLPERVPALPHDNYSYILDIGHSNLNKLTNTSYLAKSSVVKLSHNHISDISIDFFLALGHMHVLLLDFNNLKRLPANITSVNQTHLTELRLGRNPWACYCNSLETKRWMTSYKDIIRDFDIVNCNSPADMAGKNIVSVDSAYFCPGYDLTTRIVIGLSVSAGVAVLLSCTGYCIVSKKRVWVYKKTHWHPFDRNEAADEGKEFDIFVSYANEDEGYMDEYLIPELQDRGFKVCYHRVNFCGGTSIIENICTSVNNSKRCLAFFSASYKESPYCMWEFREALSKDMRDGTKNLVVIKDTNLDVDDLDETSRSYFQRFTFIEREAEGFWDNLLYSLPAIRLEPEMQQ